MESRQKIEQWISAIITEDGFNLSGDSIETLNMIKNELPILERKAHERGQRDYAESMESDY